MLVGVWLKLGGLSRFLKRVARVTKTLVYGLAVILLVEVVYKK